MLSKYVDGVTGST